MLFKPRPRIAHDGNLFMFGPGFGILYAKDLSSERDLVHQSFLVVNCINDRVPAHRFGSSSQVLARLDAICRMRTFKFHHQLVLPFKPLDTYINLADVNCNRSCFIDYRAVSHVVQREKHLIISPFIRNYRRLPALSISILAELLGFRSCPQASLPFSPLRSAIFKVQFEKLQ